MSRENALVTAEWVEENLDAPEVVLVEVDEDTTSYDEGHIPGAVKLDWTTDLQDQVRRDFVDKAAVRGAALRQGRRQRRHRRALRRQQQLVRRLRLLVLQALRPPGREAARRRAQEVGARQPQARPTRSPRARPPTTPRRSRTSRSARSATRSSTAIGTKNLVDVRSPDEYAGRLLAPAHLPQEQAQRAGHIPARGQHPVEQGGRRGRHVPLRRRAQGALRRRGRRPRARTPSPTAASASAPRTPGSRCTSCSGTREGEELRRFLDRVRLAGRGADPDRRRARHRAGHLGLTRRRPQGART